MSIEMFKDLTNAELKEECKVQGIKSIKAKNPGKPNKSEYLAAIAAKLSYVTEDDEEVEVEEEVKVAKKPRQSKAQLARLDMFRKDRVVIHDVQENQSKDKDEVLPISWGNLLLGGQTDMVALNGLPQYIRRGAIKNLLEATTIVHKPKANGNGATNEVVPRFIINEVAGMTQAELDELANQQRMRNSKLA